MSDIHPMEAKLRPHVEAIENAANAGDKNAIGVITTYKMLTRGGSDPGAHGLCEAYFGEWMKCRPRVKS